MYYVYVLRSTASNRLYTGYTSDLRKRLDQHKEGKSLYTKNRGPYELIYYEACIDPKDALAREKYLKTGTGKRYIKNRIKRFLALTG
jgi:putative endonuclease